MREDWPILAAALVLLVWWFWRRFGESEPPAPSPPTPPEERPEMGAEAAALSLGASPDVASALAKWERERNLPEKLLVALVYHESRFDPNARGSYGERGLGQVTEAALADVVQFVDRQYPYAPERLYEVDYNLWAASGYLWLSLRRAKQNPETARRAWDPVYAALVFYAAGPGDYDDPEGWAYADRVYRLWRSL